MSWPPTSSVPCALPLSLQALVLAAATSALAPASEEPLLAPPPAAHEELRSWEEALDRVRRVSPEYLTALASLQRAQEEARGSHAALLPNIAAQGTFAHQLITLTQSLGDAPTVIPAQDVFGAAAMLSWPIVSPRAWHGLGTARRSAEAAGRELAEKRRALARALVEAVLGSLSAQQVAQISRVGLRASLERRALTQAKAELGEGTLLDIDRTEQDLEVARALVIRGDEALHVSREALGLALGSRHEVAVSEELSVEGFERAVAGTCRLLMGVELRGDVAAKRLRLELAERAVRDLELQSFPSLSLVSQFGWASQVVYGPHATWSLGAVLGIPLWDGGARASQRGAARAAAEQARQALVAARLSALFEVVRSERGVKVSSATLESLRRQRELAVRIDARARAGYSIGHGTGLDLVTSAHALRQAELNLAIAALQAAQVRVLAVLSNAECTF